MKKGVILYIIYTLTIPAIMMLVSTCKSDNSLEQSLNAYEPILNLAKYINFNVSSSSYTQGVYSLSLSGTEAFDENFWGWEIGTPQSQVSYSNNTQSTASIPEYYLGSGNRTLNTVQSFNDHVPSGPQYFHIHRAIPAFADSTFPTAGATTGLIRPLRFQAIERTLYNSSGELAYDSDLKTYSLAYDDSTGLIQSYSILTQNNTSDTVTLDTFGFSADPRSYSTYYASSYTKKSGTGNALIGYVTTTIEVDDSAANPVETYTYQRFDENEALGSFNDSGDLGYLDSNFFDDANGSTIVKIVKTITTYKSASGSIAANSVVTLVNKYASASSIVYKEETIQQYESAQLAKISDYQFSAYNVSASTETQVSQAKKQYTDGYLVLDQTYSQSNGWTSPSSYTEYERDTQGRITSMKRYNSTGQLTLKEVYTFDSLGRTSTIRAYTVDSSSVATCYGVNNKDYSYTALSSGRQISETTYGCNGNNLSSSPSSKIIQTYSSTGQLALYQQYTYSSSAFLLTSQTAYGYSSNGERTYIQNYSVDGSGNATASNRTEYTYDSNRFRTSTIYKNASGQITSSYYIYSYTYK